MFLEMRASIKGYNYQEHNKLELVRGRWQLLAYNFECLRYLANHMSLSNIALPPD